LFTLTERWHAHLIAILLTALAGCLAAPKFVVTPNQTREFAVWQKEDRHG
jgi:hypothetical protein